MDKTNCFKRITSIALLFIMVLASIYTGEIPVQAAPSGTSSATSSEYVTLVRTGAEILGPSFKGDEAGATVHRFTYPTAAVKDTAGTVAYCIEPFARGVSPSGQAQTFTTVPSEQLDDLDKKLLGIMMAGYPIVTHGKSVEDEYMATQIAIQHFVFQYPDKYPNSKKVKFNNADWSHWGNDSIVDLAKTIYTQGIAKPYVPGSGTNTEIKATPENNGQFSDIGAFLEVKISLGASGTFQKGKLTLPDEIRSLVKNGKGTITVDGASAVFKPYILGSDDGMEGIEIIPGSKEVIISLDKLAAEAYVPEPKEIKSVDFEFQTIGGDALQAFKGVNLNNSNQDYIFIAPGETEPVVAALSWTRDAIPDGGGDGGSGGLKVLKYNKKTNQLVSGAIFEIRGVSESNWDFIVHIQASPGAALPLPDGGTATTGVGTITLSDIRPGQYQISELTPPPNFDYCDLGTNSQVVTVVDLGEDGNVGLYPQVRFENNPFGSLRIKKVDAVTGNPVNGAILRIRNPIANIDVEMVTMNGGIIDMQNLPQGNYEISEIFAPNSHVKSDEVKTATVRWSETADISFANQPKTELLVKKIDADTGATLSGAIFRLTRPDTGDTWEEVTYYDGYAVFQDIPAATLVLEEIKSPAGYILDTTKHTIVVENHKTNEITIQNSKKPGIVIRKYDEGTGLPLPLTEFRVAKMSGQIIYEGITDDNGEIRLDDIEPGWLKITELAAAPGYLIATEPKDVLLEPGKQLEVKFDNRRRPALEILKLDAITAEPLAGALFHVKKAESATVSEYVTDANGKITIADLDEAVYSVFEYSSPDGYITEPQHKDILLEWSKTKQFVYTNIRKPTLIVTKLNGLTGLPVPGATYRIEYESAGGLVPLGSFITDANGQIIIPKVEPGWYVATETKPAPGFSMPSNPVTRIYLSPGENAYLPNLPDILTLDGSGGITVFSGNDFPATTGAQGEPVYNYPLNSIVIKKSSIVTSELLAGATFGLYRADEQVSGVPGTLVGRYTTDHSGVIVITGLQPGFFVVKEETAPPFFLIGENNQQNGFLKADGTTVLEFSFANVPYGSILIMKTDGLTNQPLASVVFKVTDATGAVLGNSNGEYTTDSDGKVLIPNVKPGDYNITELRSVAHYAADSTLKTLSVGTDGKTYSVTFANYPYGALIIRKLDADTKEPITNTIFKVTTAQGEVVGVGNGLYTTDATGKITIPNLPKNTYIVQEQKANPNYTLEAEAKTIAVDYGKTYALDFYNTKKGSAQIIKIDAHTKAPLKGAQFIVYKTSGEVVGTYTTDGDGLIILPLLDNGWHKAAEQKSVPGYLLDDTPQDFEIKGNDFVKLVFENTPLSGLQIKKIDTITRQPIEGVEFSVSRLNGEKIGSYKTDKNGLIFVPNLTEGVYSVVEEKCGDGYLLDSEPKLVEVKRGATATVEVENTPMSGLLIVKRDEMTGKPLQGVVYDVRRADGQFVAGSILDGNQPNTVANSPNKTTSPNGDITGSYTTDANGRILINTLPAGEYHVIERKALDGYELDTEVHAATITPGKLVTLQLSNRQKAGLRLVKIDSITKLPIYNVEFMLFDANNKVVGTYYTDNQGVIDFTGEITEGRYTLRETRPAKNYYPDEMPRTVEFVAGKVTEVRWENTPHMGQIQIFKKSGDDSQVNGLPAGTPLAGAVFEAYDYKTGNLVDRFTSNADGRALSRTLPLGRYLVKEVQAPQWYRISEQPLDITLEFPMQIIKQECINYSANTGVTVRKTGNREAMAGDVIRYDIKALRNDSTIPLTDFYFRDVLPVDAVRLTKIVTGTYNQNLQYKVMIITNKGDTRVIADNLSTTANNVIDCSNAALGLRSDEYMTSFIFVYGTVKAGFNMVDTPQIYVRVVNGLPNGYMFTNKADIGGKHVREWVIGNSVWSTEVYAPKKGLLPRTGY